MEGECNVILNNMFISSTTSILCHNKYMHSYIFSIYVDEIPQGLQLIANGLAHELILNGQKRVHYRVISSSFLRLIVGYLFLSSLFINVAQNSDVISIFYDVLALEFVENIDDTAYALGKKVMLE